MLINNGRNSVSCFSGYFIEDVALSGFLFESEEEIVVDSNYDHTVISYFNDEMGYVEHTMFADEVTRKLESFRETDRIRLFVDSYSFKSMAAIIAVVDYCKNKGIPLTLAIKREENTYYFY